MPERSRERIGDFVITRPENLDSSGIICANCQKRLAALADGKVSPSCEELIDSGAVAWPNFGWFCGDACEAAYAKESGVQLERIAKDGN